MSLARQPNGRVRAPRVALALAGALVLPLAAPRAAPACRGSGAAEHLLAVLPLDNRAAVAAPAEELRAVLIERLEACGFHLVADDRLEAFLARNRVRYTGGLSDELALALRDELGVTAAFVTTLNLFDDSERPALALTARVVTPDAGGRVRWIGDFSQVGEENPGVLDMAVVRDVRVLMERAAERWARALDRSLSEAIVLPPAVADRRFRPRRTWGMQLAAEALAAGKRVAVLPFRNETERRHAGDIVALQVFRHLAVRPGIELVDPGEVRRGLLQMRLVAAEGVSVPQVDVMRVALKADLVVTGAVFEFREALGSAPPVVNFTTHLFDTADGSLLASTLSHNSGDDGVFFFDWGRTWTTHDLSSKMAGRVVRAWFGSAARPAPLAAWNEGREP